MRAGKLTLPAILGLGTLGLLPLAPAQSSDDLVNTPGALSEGGTEMDQHDFRNNIDIVDDVLKPKLDLVHVEAQRGRNNLLVVTLSLSNKTGRKVDLEMETVYKDKSGDELNTGSWIPFTLQPHGDLNYRSSSISEAAVDFLIRVRKARGH
jgi:hypothetical protein